MHHAIDILPLITKVTAIHVKLNPEGSKENKGIKTFDRMVNIGENNRIDKVFLPIKCNRNFTLPGI